MSGSKFSRIYKEIDKSAPSAKIYDFSYKQERMEIFELLNASTAYKGLDSAQYKPPRKAEPLKYHGKLARLKGQHGMDHEKRKQKQKEAEDFFKEKEIRSTMQRSLDSRQYLDEMLQKMDSNQPISSKTVERLTKALTRDDPILDRVKATASSSSSLIKSAKSLPKISSEKQKLTSTPPLAASPSNPSHFFREPAYHFENRRMIDRGRTQQKWSLEERDRLSQIYRDCPPPANQAHIEIWQLYFENIAARFLAFSPHRSREEAVAKARMMIAKRQMKERGEEEYWQRISSTAAQQLRRSSQAVSKSHNRQNAAGMYT